jgi:3-oxoacyl-[acyl-carrier-protein] synthase-3
MALDALARALRIDPGKVFSNISEIGNTVSASLPIAMKDAQTQGLLRPGRKVVACGFGVGLTWASALIEF